MGGGIGTFNNPVVSNRGDVSIVATLGSGRKRDTTSENARLPLINKKFSDDPTQHNATTGEDSDQAVDCFADLLRAARLDVDHAGEGVALERRENVEGSSAIFEVHGLAHQTEDDIPLLPGLYMHLRIEAA